MLSCLEFSFHECKPEHHIPFSRRKNGDVGNLSNYLPIPELYAVSIPQHDDISCFKIISSNLKTFEVITYRVHVNQYNLQLVQFHRTPISMLSSLNLLMTPTFAPVGSCQNATKFH